jgi:hypothetical protein
MVSRVWYVWRVGAALARLDLQRRTLDRAFLQATFRLAMVEGLTPEETAALVFWQMPATLRSDGALLLLRDWRRAGRIDAERHQGFVAFAAGAPYAQVFPAAARYHLAPPPPLRVNGKTPPRRPPPPARARSRSAD